MSLLDVRWSSSWRSKHETGNETIICCAEQIKCFKTFCHTVVDAFVKLQRKTNLDPSPESTPPPQHQQCVRTHSISRPVDNLLLTGNWVLEWCQHHDRHSAVGQGHCEQTENQGPNTLDLSTSQGVLELHSCPVAQTTLDCTSKYKVAACWVSKLGGSNFISHRCS